MDESTTKAFISLAKQSGYSDDDIRSYLAGSSTVSDPEAQARQPAVADNTPIPYPITQTYGQPSQYDVFSGGINTGVDYAAPKDTPVYLPQGNWMVEKAYAEAKNGYIGDNENSGYGNSVMVKNNDTGEKVRISHLNAVGVQPGQTLQGGLLGLTGGTGNVTGPHADVEYYDPNGRMGDVLNTPYRNLFAAPTTGK